MTIRPLATGSEITPYFCLSLLRVKENCQNGGLEDNIFVTTFLGGPRPGGVGVLPWVCPMRCPCSPGGLWGMCGPTGVTWV
jgi:hypothetical protein